MKKVWMLVAVILGAAVVCLFLLPAVPITVAQEQDPYLPGTLHVAPVNVSASASPMYAWFGFGAVYVPNGAGGHSYCLMRGNPGTMCGAYMQRMMDGT
jgi:hypothetical protein